MAIEVVGNYIYLRIPNEYECIYDNLLRSLSSIGTNSIGNCNGRRFIDKCLGINPCGKTLGDLIDSWNMFQIACASHELGEYSKADKIITYINSKMSFNCPTNYRIIYYGEVDYKPTLNDILAGNTYNVYSKTNSFSLRVEKKGHYIAIPSTYSIKTIENASFRGDWLYEPNIGIDIYTREEILIEGVSYTLWYCEFPVAFDATVEVII